MDLPRAYDCIPHNLLTANLEFYGADVILCYNGNTSNFCPFVFFDQKQKQK